MPVSVPEVDAAPVVITVVRRVPILAVVILASAIFAFAEIVRYPAENALAVAVLVTVRLLEEILPVTVTAPNVVLPPLAVAVKASQANAFASPSVGQT